MSANEQEKKLIEGTAQEFRDYMRENGLNIDFISDRTLDAVDLKFRHDVRRAFLLDLKAKREAFVNTGVEYPETKDYACELACQFVCQMSQQGPVYTPIDLQSLPTMCTENGVPLYQQIPVLAHYASIENGIEEARNEITSYKNRQKTSGDMGYWELEGWIARNNAVVAILEKSEQGITVFPDLPETPGIVMDNIEVVNDWTEKVKALEAPEDG